MATNITGAIQVHKGTFGTSNTLSTNLTANYMAKPVIRSFVEIVEGRYLTNLIAMGIGDNSKYSNFKSLRREVKSPIRAMESREMIDDVKFQYAVQGRIEQNSVILGQVGSSEGNLFKLRLRDNYPWVGSVCIFWNQNQARVTAEPIPDNGSFIYSFQTADGSVFDLSKWVTPQRGEKTLMPKSAVYGEKSKQGYGRVHSPDTFVQYLTTQRLGFQISGDALRKTLWYEYAGTKMWDYEAVIQLRAKWNSQWEFEYWKAQTSMLDASGNAVSVPLMDDFEVGTKIWRGQGIEQMIAPSNVIDASGTGNNSGMPTLDDLKDAMRTFSKKSNWDKNITWYAVTGTDGYQHLQDELETKANQQGMRWQVSQGAEVEVGFDFTTYRDSGNKVILVRHPMFDDDKLFPARNGSGRLSQSSTIYLLDNTEYQGGRNMEILTAKGNHINVDRAEVQKYFSGMPIGTALGDVFHPGDHLDWQIFGQRAIVIYNTATCGIIRSPQVN